METEIYSEDQSGTYEIQNGLHLQEGYINFYRDGKIVDSISIKRIAADFFYDSSKKTFIYVPKSYCFYEKDVKDSGIK